MWEPRPLATLGDSTACNRDIFTFTFFTISSNGYLYVCYYVLTSSLCVVFLAQYLFFFLLSGGEWLVSRTYRCTRKKPRYRWDRSLGVPRAYLNAVDKIILSCTYRESNRIQFISNEISCHPPIILVAN
jgi:hypothetical protein